VAPGLEEGVRQATAVMALTWRLPRRPKAAESPKTVQAAGGVVWRRNHDRLEVLLVHRPRYDDWSLPKGKLTEAEDHASAALREVEEETGLRCHLGYELPATSYRDRRGRPKVVRYWAMTPIDGRFAPSREVDEVRWVPATETGRVLSYHWDRAVVDAVSSIV
jgi:8-oxo-dGTP diphosphatase